MAGHRQSKVEPAIVTTASDHGLRRNQIQDARLIRKQVLLILPSCVLRLMFPFSPVRNLSVQDCAGSS